MAEIIELRRDGEPPDDGYYVLCECGCPLWIVEDEKGRRWPICPICTDGPDDAA